VSASTPAGGGAPARPDASLRILLAEDSEDNRLLVRSILRDHVLDEAADGGSAVGKFTGGRYDIVLMDVQMPVLDGYAATRELRAAGYNLPIVALTAHAMADDRQKCLDAGCDDYASKPIKRLELLSMLARLARVTLQPV
jgi:CheY-like chemotaxis protein